jgi:hypothetical protein
MKYMNRFLVVALMCCNPSSPALALDWPQNICHALQAESCLEDGFTIVAAELGSGQQEYCIASDYWALQYFPDRLDLVLTVKGYDEFTPPMKITPRQTLRILCHP